MSAYRDAATEVRGGRGHSAAEGRDYSFFATLKHLALCGYRDGSWGQYIFVD